MIDRIDKKIFNLKKMQKNLELSLAFLDKTPKDFRVFVEDSVALRYGILIKSLWKLIAAYLQEREVEFIASPRDTIKKAFEVNFLIDQERKSFLRYLKFRSITFEMYDGIKFQELLKLAPHMLDFSKIVLRKLENN